MKELLRCWGWREATDYGPVSISTFVLLVHPSCCLLLGSQQLLSSGHSLTAGAEYLVLGISPSAAHPWYRLGVFTGYARVSSPPAMCSAFAELGGTQGNNGVLWGHSLASQGSQRLSVETPALWMGWDRSTILPSLAGAGGGEEATRGISVPACCKMPYYFHALQLKDLLSLKGFFFF